MRREVRPVTLGNRKGIACHGTPITPRVVLEALGERDYFVSHFRPDDVEWIDANSRSWRGDNGIFSLWQASLKAGVEMVYTRERYQAYVQWCRRWCLEGSGRCQWVVIPDPIGTGTQELDAMLREWPSDLAAFGRPVYHLDEPIDRALRLLDRYGVLCVGATGEYRVIPSAAFCARMDELFDAIWNFFGYIPDIHLFRALQLMKPEFPWPASSWDSTTIARNHHLLKNAGTTKPPRRVKAGLMKPTREALFDLPASEPGEAVSEHYLWKVQQAANRWDALASSRTFDWRTDRGVPVIPFHANQNTPQPKGIAA